MPVTNLKGGEVSHKYQSILGWKKSWWCKRQFQFTHTKSTHTAKYSIEWTQNVHLAIGSDRMIGRSSSKAVQYMLICDLFGLPNRDTLAICSPVLQSLGEGTFIREVPCIFQNLKKKTLGTGKKLRRCEEIYFISMHNSFICLHPRNHLSRKEQHNKRGTSTHTISQLDSWHRRRKSLKAVHD